MPLTIDLSQANLPAGTPAYAYIIGGYVTAPTPAPKPIVNYRLDASGRVHLLSTGDNTNKAKTFPGSSQLNSADAATIAASYPDDWADYSIPLLLTAPTIIDLSGINPTNLPGLGVGTNAFSARVYISLGIPILPFTVQAANGDGPNPFSGPAPDSSLVGTPGSLCLFDWFEFSITGPGPSTAAGLLNGNTTMVDEYALPLIITASPNGGGTQGKLNLTRTALMNDINTFPALYPTLTQPVTAPSAYPAGTNYLRALSPDHVSGAGGGSTAFQTYFDAIIAQWYKTWSTTPIVVTDTATGTYSGMNIGGSLIFIAGNYTTQSAWNAAAPGAPQINFGAITTAEIWQCNGALASGSTAQQNIGKQILAAFNRGIMSNSLDDGSCPAATTFYPAGVPSNLWAQKFHQWNANGLAYGFAYDDVCKQNPSQQTSGPLESLNITLGAMF